MKRHFSSVGPSILLAIAFAPLALAAPITPGNLIVYRVGDGSAPGVATNLATAVFLDEYTPYGALVQSIALPTTGSGALTAVGNATTEGMMSFTQNGLKVVFTGYRKNVGGTNPGGDAPSTTPRVIALFDPATGVFDTTSYAVTDATGTIRSATSTDGSSLFYLSASGNFVRYVGSPGPSSTSVQIDARNSRQVLLKDNVLYASNGSTAITGKVQHYGVLPTTATAATPIVSLATNDAVHGITFFDLNASVPGVDTLYAMSVVEGRLRKYSFDGTTWQNNGFLNMAGMGQGNVAGYEVGGAIQLFFSTGSSLVTLTDTSGWNGTLAGTFTTLANAPANTAFRGLVAVVPEPGAWAMLGLGLSAVLLFRRKS